MNKLELINQIVANAVQVNLQGNHHVFVDIAGHVNSIRVSIYVGGWSMANWDADPTYNRQCYYSDWEYDDETGIDNCIVYLQDMLQNIVNLLGGDDNGSNTK